MSDTEDFDFDDDSSDFDFDDDFADMDSGDSPSETDRNPVATAGKAAIDTVADELQNTERVMSTVKENMPSGYQAAWQVADDVVGTTKELYNDAAKDLKPAMTQMKRNTKRLLPMVKGVMPESIGNKIESFLSDDDTAERANAAAADADTAAIANSLGSIFQQQAEQEQGEKQEEVARETIRDNIEDAQATKSITLNVDISNQLARLNAYNDNVQSKVSKQALELKFRTYFTLRDLLAVTKSTAQDTVIRLTDIVKNTSLPDAAKIQNSEAFRQQYYAKMFGGVQDKMLDFSGRMRDNLVGKAKDKIQSAKDAMAQGVEMSGALAEAQEMSAEAGIKVDPSELAGQMAAGNVMDRVFRKFGTFAGGMMNKNDKVMTGSNILNQITSDPEGIVRALADADENTEIMGVKVKDNPILKALAKAAGIADPGSVSEMEQVSVMANQRSMLTEPAIYDGMARKSIVEIIPEYLSRILSETIKFNGGDSERMTYSLEKGRLTSMSEATRLASETLDNKGNDDEYGNKVVSLINSIDTEDKLNLEDKQALADYLGSRSNDKKFFDPASVVSELKGSMSDTDQEGRLVDLLSEQFGIGEDGKMVKSRANTANSAKLSKQYMALRKHEVKGQAELAEYASSGGLNLLHDSGLLSDTEAGYVWNQSKTDQNRKDAIAAAFIKDRSVESNAKDFVGDTSVSFNHGGAQMPAMLSGRPGGFRMYDTPIAGRPAPTVTKQAIASVQSVLADVPEEAAEVAVKPMLPPLGRRGPGKRQGGFFGGPEVKADKSVTTDKYTNVFDSQPIVDVLNLIKEDTANIYDIIKDGITVDNNTEVNVAAPAVPVVNVSGPDQDFSEPMSDLMGSMAYNFNNLNGELGNIQAAVNERGAATANIISESQSATHHLLSSLIDTNRTGFSALVDRAGVAVEVAAKEPGFLKKAFGKTFGLGWKGIKGTTNLGLSGMKLGFKGGLATAKATAKGTLASIRGVGNSLLKPLRGLNHGDIYVKGDRSGKPVLTKASLVAGRYFDAESGKVIERFSKKTLQNGVKDKDGNYVLTPDHIEAGLTNANGKSIGVRLGKTAMWVTDKLTLGIAGRTWKAVKGIGKLKDAVNSKVKRFVGKALRTDVYVAGEDKPRLLYSELLNKRYRSAKTGLVLESFADIDGAVVDMEGVTLLSEEELDTIRTSTGTKLKVKSTLGAYASLMVKPVTLALKPLRMLNDMRKDRNKRRETTDVYITGRKEPVLTAVKLRLGEYYCKDTGEQLKSFWKIKGPIADASGKVLLTSEDIEGGLFSQFGKKIQAGIITRTLKGVAKMGSGIINAMSMGKFGKAISIDEEGDASIKKIVKHFVNKMDVRARSVKIYTNKQPEDSNGLASKAGGKIKAIKDNILGRFSRGKDKDKEPVEELNSETIKPSTKSVPWIKGKGAKEILARTNERFKDVVLAPGAKDRAKDKVADLKESAKSKTIDGAAIFREMMAPRMAEMQRQIDAEQKKSDGLVEKLKKTVKIDTSKVKKKIFGDADGDGDRDGGMKDTLAERAKEKTQSAAERIRESTSNFHAKALGLFATQNKIAKENAENTEDIAEGQTGWVGLLKKGWPILTGLLGSVVSGITGMAKVLAAKVFGGGASDALDLVDGPDGGKSKGKKGWWNKAKNMGKGVLNFGKRHAGKLATAATSLVSSGALASAGTMIAGAAATAASAIGAVLASPVVLVGAAVVAVGAGAYYTYKYAQRRKKVHPMEAVRYSQYGVNTSIQDDVIAVRYLEDKLEGDITSKTVDLDVVEVVEDYASDFGIGDDDQAGKDRFATWLAKRFVPVFQTWQIVAERYDSDARSIHGDLEPKDLVPVAKSTMYTGKDAENPYAVVTPFTEQVPASAIKDAITALGTSEAATGKAERTISSKINSKGEVVKPPVIPDSKKPIPEATVSDEVKSKLGTTTYTNRRKTRQSFTKPRIRMPVKDENGLWAGVLTDAQEAEYRQYTIDDDKKYNSSALLRRGWLKRQDPNWRPFASDDDDFTTSQDMTGKLSPVKSKVVPGDPLVKVQSKFAPTVTVVERTAEERDVLLYTGKVGGPNERTAEQRTALLDTGGSGRGLEPQLTREQRIALDEKMEREVRYNKYRKLNSDGHTAVTGNVSYDGTVGLTTNGKRSPALKEVSRKRQELAAAQVQAGEDVSIPPNLMPGATPTSIAMLNSDAVTGSVTPSETVVTEIKRQQTQQVKADKAQVTRDAVKLKEIDDSRIVKAETVQKDQLNEQRTMSANLAALVRETREANKAMLKVVREPVEVNVKAEPIEVLTYTKPIEKPKQPKAPKAHPGLREVVLPVSMGKSNLQK